MDCFESQCLPAIVEMMRLVLPADRQYSRQDNADIAAAKVRASRWAVAMQVQRMTPEMKRYLSAMSDFYADMAACSLAGIPFGITAAVCGSTVQTVRAVTNIFKSTR